MVYKIMKGIILAGGAGTRLHPITKVVSKQLLPIYDQPMIYYPLSILINSGIDDIMIISTPEDKHLFQRLLGDGDQWGVKISYSIQEKPQGIAQAFLISESWLNQSSCLLILGDNLFFGPSINNLIKEAIDKNTGATIFGYRVNDPNRFGVIEFDQNKNVISLEEKPIKPKSDWIATGLYIYDAKAVERTKSLNFSKRNELEITDLLKIYKNKNKLSYDFMGRGSAWLDTGSPKNLLSTSEFISTIEDRQGLKIGCIEEIAFNYNWINAKHIKQRIKYYGKSEYSNYLKNIIS